MRNKMAKPLPSSLWAATAVASPVSGPLDKELTADVAIVGAGYTGLSAALHLAAGGARVAVLEASEPGWGASGRNGGQIIAGLKHDPQKLKRVLGRDLGSRVTKEFGGSADLVFSLIDRYGIACNDRRSGWIQGAHGRKAFEEMVAPRCRQWAEQGVDARLLDRAEMAAMVGSSDDAYYGGWLDPRGGVLQPLSYARGLAAAAMHEGAQIFSASPVRMLRRQGDLWELETAGGKVRAPRVILATNAYTDGLWPGLRQTVIPVASFQAATRPLPASIRDTILPGGQGVADTRRLLLYFRLDHEGRLVMGGRSPVADAPRFEDAGTLQAAMARIFPQTAGAALDYVWSGKVAITADALPHLHVLAPDLYAALGCNGRGVAACTVIGRLLARLASGTPPEEIPFPVTAPRPIALHAFRELAVFTLSQWYRIMDRLEARS
jgi:glycine/D-amino acid oxidase-like deaminating enzyme